MKEISEKFINLEEVVRSKSPRMANAMPGFAMRYLRRIVHQDEINKFLWENKDKEGLDFVSACHKELGTTPKAIGLSSKLLEGSCLVAANHPLGGVDGLALVDLTGKLRPDVVVPSNDLLLFMPNVESILMGINKHGSNADNIRSFEQTFGSERLILYFPAGLVSRRQNGVIRDLEWKITFIKKAIKYKRDIIPTHIDGQNSAFFYNLAIWRKKLNIKANIEMLYLADEMYKFRDKEITIRFGQRIPWQTFDKSRKPAEWAAMLKDHVYRIGESDDPQSIEFKP